MGGGGGVVMQPVMHMCVIQVPRLLKQGITLSNNQTGASQSGVSTCSLSMSRCWGGGSTFCHAQRYESQGDRHHLEQ